MGFEPMNNGFAGRRVSHFATRAHIGRLLHCALKHETHCVWQWVRQELEIWSRRLIPNARTSVRAAATHVATTGVHRHQAAHRVTG